MLRIRTAIFRVAIRHEVDRVLVDLSAAVLVLSDDDWRTYTQHCASRNALRITSALLVPPVNQDEAWAHAEDLSAFGRINVAFTDRSAAYRWARLDLLAGQSVARASEA